MSIVSLFSSDQKGSEFSEHLKEYFPVLKSNLYCEVSVPNNRIYLK